MAFRLHFYTFVSGEGWERQCTLTSRAILEWLRREVMTNQSSGSSCLKPNMDFYDISMEELIRLKELCQEILQSPVSAPERLSLFSEFDDEEEQENYQYGKNYFHNLKKYITMVENLKTEPHFIRYYFTYHY